MSLNEILTERGSNYGDFKQQGNIAQELKAVMHKYNNNLTLYQKEAIEMILHKIARILNGNPNYKDSWVDIAGYAQLIVNVLDENLVK